MLHLLRHSSSVDDVWGLFTPYSAFTSGRRDIPPHFVDYIDEAVQRALRARILPRDYAIAADGGMIIPELSTFPLPDSMSSTLPISARIILRDNLDGGRCWQSHSTRGQVGIALPHPIIPSRISVDHVPAEAADDILQAPRNIRLWGALDGDVNEERYGRFMAEYSHSRTPSYLGPPLTAGYTFVALANLTYDIHSTSFVQTFALNEELLAYRIAFGVFVIEILDNWGSDYTCLYRIRVHGNEAGKTSGSL
ncbi:hypothetical protein BV20DRAFT_937317 [Pilatotrama ljubarskyi]|nr:hypothetical protein BV20DRAFT_937317 [Pilatotrama ljubarskyi]